MAKAPQAEGGHTPMMAQYLGIKADFPDTLRKAGWVAPANSPASPSPSASARAMSRA